MFNELLNQPLRKILKPSAVPSQNLVVEDEDSRDRKRRSAENRSSLAAKRSRKEIVEALLQESRAEVSLQKDAEVQVDSDGKY